MILEGQAFLWIQVGLNIGGATRAEFTETLLQYGKQYWILFLRLTLWLGKIKNTKPHPALLQSCLLSNTSFPPILTVAE